MEQPEQTQNPHQENSNGNEQIPDWKKRNQESNERLIAMMESLGVKVEIGPSGKGLTKKWTGVFPPSKSKE